MASHLRIARTPFDAEKVVRLGPNPLCDYYPHLFSIVSGRVPQVTMSLLARPVTSANKDYREWYSDFSGQPVTLISLPDAARSQIETLIEDRLVALKRVADTLETEGKKGEAIALRLACKPPTPNMVYVIGGQPVIINWDYTRSETVAKKAKSSLGAFESALPGAQKAEVNAVASETERGAPPPAPPISAPPTKPLLLLSVLAVLAAGAGLAGLSDHLQWGPFEGKAAVESERTQLEEEIAQLEAELKKRLSACPSVKTQ
ncbi:hypothetical protein FACS1894205_7450 [Alphaproteobacteria bacterium]|nr:hypothetical protein FACS1894205_7450 [Alphaproteobacteria bacterium]